MKIEGIEVGEILDSRGEKTLEVSIVSDGVSHSTRVPSGRSRGRNEAVPLGAGSAERVLEDGLEEVIVRGKFNSTSEFDMFLIENDGTDNKSKIGGDLSLGLSVSFARSLAAERGKELWELLRDEFFESVTSGGPPQIFANMINGGKHADTNLDIQEYQVVGVTKGGVRQTINEVKNLYSKLGELLSKKYGSEKIAFGDEQGYALNFGSNFEPLKALKELLFESAHKEEFALGIDAAASSFYDGESYGFEGKKITPDDLYNKYLEYFEKCDQLRYIEDPFAENDVESFRKILGAYGKSKLIIGDDITTTNAKLIENYANEAINGVIIKPNQIGTVTETCEAMTTAKRAGIKRIVSHRSGEVEDPFLIHFAKAAGAEGVKIGVPVIKERICKFDELARLYS